MRVSEKNEWECVKCAWCMRLTSARSGGDHTGSSLGYEDPTGDLDRYHGDR